MYVPHLHIRAGYEHMPIPIQQHHQHPSELASFRPTVSPPSAFDPCTVGGTTRSANIMQHLPPHNHAMINLHQECNGPHPFHPKHVYHGNHQTVLQGAAGHSSDMPQQWSFLKLPAIGNIFHSLSPSDLSQGGSKQDSSDSGTPSPADSSSMTPPLWESSGSMISNRQDDAHMQETSPNMYKGSSMWIKVTLTDVPWVTVTHLLSKIRQQQQSFEELWHLRATIQSKKIIKDIKILKI